MLCLKLPPHLLAYVAVFMACQSVGTQLVDPINNQPFWTVANFRERFLKGNQSKQCLLRSRLMDECNRFGETCDSSFKNIRR
ncbi:hypothetical protein BJ742DRAFT_321679 [Cladochytrium replicatum]|nr:hypothetical protein BJ742DRAFT_321679 [Cladochytrium replicatum]